jgi:2-polyprenyl-3-methyl-5-hydroxy-6-metoxy-1,4-benzoquinol methylase
MDKFSTLSLNYYNRILNKHGNNFKGMNWSSKKSQYIRFEKLLKISKLENKSIHDLGCGNAELLNVLKIKKIKFKNYLGSDLSNKMIQLCNERFKKNKRIKFESFDILKKKNLYKYDYVITSGIFNVKNSIHETYWKKYVFKVIKKMFLSCKCGIGLNFLTFDTTFREKKLFYMSLDDLVKFLRKKISKKIVINHDYDLWEFTVFIYK